MAENRNQEGPRRQTLKHEARFECDHGFCLKHSDKLFARRRWTLSLYFNHILETGLNLNGSTCPSVVPRGVECSGVRWSMLRKEKQILNSLFKP